MRRSFIFIVTVFLSFGVSGCFVGSGKAEPAYYDLAGGEFPRQAQDRNVAGGAMSGSVLSPRRIEVRAPAWLNSPAMQYRLAYLDANRRMSFSGSRWVAPPPELLETVLKRRFLTADHRPEIGGCQLLVELDEFIQVFDGPEQSHSVIEARVTLFSMRDAKLAIRRGFSYVMPAGADVRAGLVGFNEAVARLSVDLTAWFSGLDQALPALAGQCRT